MQRKKGQFASSRPSQEEGAVAANWDGSQAPGQPLGPGGVQPEVTYATLLTCSAIMLSYFFMGLLALSGSLGRWRIWFLMV